MRLVEIFVDELPPGCSECLFNNTEYGECNITKISNWLTTLDGKEDCSFPFRPNFCPLKVKTEDWTDV